MLRRINDGSGHIERAVARAFVSAFRMKFSRRRVTWSFSTNSPIPSDQFDFWVFGVYLDLLSRRVDEGVKAKVFIDGSRYKVFLFVADLFLLRAALSVRGDLLFDPDLPGALAGSVFRINACPVRFRVSLSYFDGYQSSIDLLDHGKLFRLIGDPRYTTMDYLVRRFEIGGFRAHREFCDHTNLNVEIGKAVSYGWIVAQAAKDGLLASPHGIDARVMAGKASRIVGGLLEIGVSFDGSKRALEILSKDRSHE